MVGVFICFVRIRLYQLPHRFCIHLTAGEIPKELGNLVSVKRLDLSGNQLTGT